MGLVILKNPRLLYIVAYWCKDGSEIAKYNEYDTTPLLGINRYFLKHSIIVHNKSFEQWFACCEWFQSVNTDIRYRFGNPVEVLYRNLFKQFGPASYTPVQCVLSKFGHAPYDLRSNDLIVIFPRFTVSWWLYFKEILHGAFMSRFIKPI